MTKRLQLDTGLHGMADAAERARELAAAGFDGAFTFEGPHDPFAPLFRAADATPLTLYTNVAIALPRNPMQLAQMANDLQLLSEGRFLLGLGSQVRAQIERRFGASFSPPVARMRELVMAMRAIFECWQTGGRLNFRGEYYQHTLMTPMFNPGPNPFGSPKILLGGLGPKMVEMTATVADGLLVMPFASERSLHELTMPAVDRGLTASGRGREDFSLICEVIVCCGRDDVEQAQADAGVSNLLSFYGSTPSYRPVLEVHGWGELQTELNTLSKQGGWAEMAKMVSDEMRSTLAVRGTPEQVAVQIVDRYRGLADRVGFYLPYSAAPDLAPAVIAAIRAEEARRDAAGT